ncbi:glutamate-5-semialdehyde dehydrogenase [Candidatus Solincola tengchongensis]|uniref:glutamate-5-semialdehyde dehydrogenase n=1 Tax=Candidatus Solincola tengchongensis TaxID=2900693 RepID=UPI00257BE155|nr:glutamate-5-semialdehyde dehydrogenase [Candidatus Solincola tengchongensis]
MDVLEEIGKRAKEASLRLGTLTTEVKNRALEEMADALLARQEDILSANRLDLEAGKESGMSSALLDRLALDPKRVEEMARGLREVAALPDPVGELVAGWRLPNGLEIQKVRVPLGVVGIIYEARPNVIVDAAGLCVKSGNAVILRGSSSAANSNRVLTEVIAAAGERAGLPSGSIQLVPLTDRESAKRLMRMREYLDVLIPRGGEGLIRTVVEESTVPVIETGVGNCHTYVDASADLEMALEIVINAKCQRPGVCNAMETLLVHEAVAGEFLPRAAEELRARGVTLRGCPRTREILPGTEEATEEDWYREYLDLILAVKVVPGLEEAIGHINRYGSKHSEAIITRDYQSARRFVSMVDSADVYVNASTRFTDGGQFGLGAEIGISTQKLHARGPMSLRELTSTKFIIWGEGQVRV